MSKLHICFTALLCMVLILPQHVSSQTRQITLNEAVDIALEKNIDILQAKNNLERSDAAVRRARGQFLPNLNASMSANRSVGREFEQSTQTFGDFTQNTISGEITTNVPIFTGWQNISNLRQARLDRDANLNDYQRFREDMIFQTVSEFLNVILNLELLEVAKENLETTQKQLEQVDAQVEVGMRPIVDLFNQESEVANAELQVIQSRSNLNTSKVRLVRILQLDPLEEYEFVTPDVDTENIIPGEFDLRELLEAAVNNRREVRSAELQIESAEHGLRAARSGYWPTLSMGANVRTAYGDQYRFFGEPASFSDQFFDQRIGRGIGLSLSIPIFDRFQTRTNVVNSQIDLKNRRLDLEDQKSLIYQEVRQAYEDYITLTQELVATDTALRAAEKAFETQQERYNVGSTTLIELTQANNAFFDATSRKIQTTYQFIFQEKILDYYIGRITEDVRF